VTAFTRFRPWMAAVALIVVAVAMVVLLPRLTGSHDAHGGASVDRPSPAQTGAGGSSALRVGVVGLLFGGWAGAFIVGIWRRWRVTDEARSDYDNVSDPG
jgi:hypothetical protein